MTKKIDDFIFQVSVEAGLENTEEVKVPESATKGFGDSSEQQLMLQTGNTSLFRLEKTKNDD